MPFGPPIPGPPWFWPTGGGQPGAIPSADSSPLSPPPPPPPSPPVPPPSHAGIDKPFIERVPDAVPRRLARHTEKVSNMLNSYMRQGIMYETAPGVWQIDVTAQPGSGLTGIFNSGAF